MGLLCCKHRPHGLSLLMLKISGHCRLPGPAMRKRSAARWLSTHKCKWWHNWVTDRLPDTDSLLLDDNCHRQLYDWWQIQYEANSIHTPWAASKAWLTTGSKLLTRLGSLIGRLTNAIDWMSIALTYKQMGMQLTAKQWLLIRLCLWSTNGSQVPCDWRLTQTVCTIMEILYGRQFDRKLELKHDERVSKFDGFHLRWALSCMQRWRLERSETISFAKKGTLENVRNYDWLGGHKV